MNYEEIKAAVAAWKLKNPECWAEYTAEVRDAATQEMQRNKAEHGSVIWHDIEVVLRQDAYIDGCDGDVYYTASAQAMIDGLYVDLTVRWSTLPEFDPTNGDDEGNACDWDNPTSIDNWDLWG